MGVLWFGVYPKVFDIYMKRKIIPRIGGDIYGKLNLVNII
jgi:hypothetical protein